MAKHIKGQFDGESQPKSRKVAAETPQITTQSDNGEPEKNFDRPPVDVPKPRPIPPKTPEITTLGGGEPEKNFGTLITPDLD